MQDPTRPLRRTGVVALGTASYLILIEVTVGAGAAGGTDPALWSSHQEQIAAAPKDAYHLDRFRSVRGTVMSSDGRLLAGCRVQLVDLRALMSDFAGDSQPVAGLPVVPVAAEATTGANGRYVFPLPKLGLYSICFDADGHAPAREDNIVVQEGYANWYLDTRLELERSLSVTVDAAPGLELLLTTDRWWPREWRAVANSTGVASFSGLGGDARHGVLWSVKGGRLAYLSRWSLPMGEEPHVELTVAARDEASEALPRLADALRSPLLAFDCLEDPAAYVVSKLSGLPIGSRPGRGLVPGAGSVHGFSSRAYLPVQLEAVDRPWRDERICSEAGEFWFTNLPPGRYVCFSAGERGAGMLPQLVVIEPGEGAETRFSQLDRIEPGRRIVQGFVTWEDGTPIAGAVVYCQDAQDLRMFLRSVEVDDTGIFRIEGLAQARTYFLVAELPDGGGRSWERLIRLDGELAEARVELRVHRLEVSGRVKPGAELELQVQQEKDWITLRTVQADENGWLQVSYIHPGTYRVLDGNEKASIRRGDAGACG